MNTGLVAKYEIPHDLCLEMQITFSHESLPWLMPLSESCINNSLTFMVNYYEYLNIHRS